VEHCDDDISISFILWPVDMLLGGDREIGYCTAARKQNRGIVFSARPVKQQLNSKRGTVFSASSVPRYYEQDN
jgi:hypothetical protein